MKQFRLLGINFMLREICSFINLCRNLICCNMEWTLTFCGRDFLALRFALHKSQAPSWCRSIWISFLSPPPPTFFPFWPLLTFSYLSLFWSLLERVYILTLLLLCFVPASLHFLLLLLFSASFLVPYYVFLFSSIALIALLIWIQMPLR